MHLATGPTSASAIFMLLNVAVGGAWPGDPDASTVLPQQMLVDYVRVYRR
jgi:beta-glucanase (GH16 family)